MILEANDISFRYHIGSAQILSQFNIRLQRDERVGLVAPSGYGKTTLLKILAGYENADSGSVLLDGRPIQDYKGYCPVQMIFQHPETVLNPRLKLAVSLKEAGLLPRRILDGLGIEDDWLTRYPAELSGGELQRFCIARALGEQTVFLLADEISTMLDLITQAQIWDFLLKELEMRHIGLLAVSHTMELIQRLTTRTVTLDQR